MPRPQPQPWTIGRSRIRGPLHGAVLAWLPTAWLAAVVLVGLHVGLACAAAAAEPAKPATAARGSAGASPAASPSAAQNDSPSDHEAEYVARLDKAIAPLRDYDLSAEDIAKVAAAFKTIAGNGAAAAADLKVGISDPLAQRLIDWERLRRGHDGAAEYLAFLNQNPNWPNRELLERRMEETLFEEGGDSDVIATYFKSGTAQGAAGMAVLASVHLAHGEKDQAQALAAKVWREHDLPADLERGFLSRFGSLLSEQDHKWRLDRLLVDDVRYKTERDERAALAKRVIPLLSAPEQKKAEARLAVFLRKHGGKAPLGAGPQAAGADWGLVFHKIQQLRRAEKLDEAAKLLRGAPTDPALVVNLDDWWRERQSLAYIALKAHKPKVAYELVRDAGPLSTNALNDQQFMAGWIALRFLDDAKTAEKHFADFARSADGPLSRAKANYWVGRTAEKLGNREKAQASYRAAALDRDTFHGLLAMQKLTPGRSPLKLEPPAEASPEQVAKFTNLDVAKAFALARKAGLSRSVTRVFLLRLAALENDEAWSAMAAHLAGATDDTQTAVRIGKAAIARGQNLIFYSYPVHALPAYTPLRPPPETAFLLGLARQETEFNSDTVSGAGARGILQVMKSTASHVCRDYKIKCNQQRLLTDSSYNTMIASAYVADRMAEWSGSYVLGLSSYNAGPGRTREWIAEFGDPRRPGVDPIDWIERIPIEETRRYVAKVLSNIQIYRARLGEKEALRLDEDLSRAREASHSPPKQAGGTDTADSRD